jgi:MFS family permease
MSSLPQTARRKMIAFVVVWFGQLVSLTGSGLTEFALGVWVFQRTGSPVQFALIILFATLPRILLSPLAGTLVDRWDRRLVMLFSDTGAGLGTLTIALLLFANQLQIWHIYLVTAFSSAFGTFQRPAYAAATTLLVPPQQYGRANGMMSLIRSVSSLVAPALAGFLIVTIGLPNVLLIDLGTFLFAVLTLSMVRFPSPPPSAESQATQGSLFHEAIGGWTYITRRPGLLGLLILQSATWFLGVPTEVLLQPYVLSFSSPDALGLIMSATGAGLLIGGLIMGAWGGPKRRIYGITGFEMLVCLCSVLIGLSASPLAIGVAAFLYFVCIELSDSSNQALWQSKVAPDFQGRVFAIQQMITVSALPLGLLITAPLAEYVFNPLLDNNGALTGSVGRIIGVGSGRGIGLMFIVAGLFNMLALIAGALYPRIWRVESELPDVITESAQTSTG